MIELDRLTKTFGEIRAVDDLSLEVGRGEVLGFLGPNGAGKTTTMRMVTGYLLPTSGTARVCGVDILKDPVKAKRRLGYLPEGAPAWPDMTPSAFLKFISATRGLSGKEGRTAIERAAKMAAISRVMDQPIETLSKGYKRRVGLAQALLHDPDVLILDEPTDGLDPNQKHEVRNLIREMRGQKAIIVSTHILEEVEAVCTRAVIISRGRVVADGTPFELEARSPRHNGVLVRFDAGLTGDAIDKAQGLIGTVQGVASVERTEDGCLFAFAAEGRAIAADVGARLGEAGICIAEMRVERGRMDDVFRAITAPGDETSAMLHEKTPTTNHEGAH